MGRGWRGGEERRKRERRGGKGRQGSEGGGGMERVMHLFTYPCMFAVHVFVLIVVRNAKIQPN